MSLRHEDGLQQTPFHESSVFGMSQGALVTPKPITMHINYPNNRGAQSREILMLVAKKTSNNAVQIQNLDYTHCAGQRHMLLTGTMSII